MFNIFLKPNFNLIKCFTTKAVNKTAHLEKTIIETKTTPYNIAIDYLQKSLQRNIDFNKNIIEKNGNKKLFYDFTLLKLCQLHNVSLKEIYKLDDKLTLKLDSYKLPTKIYVGLSSGIDSTFSTAILTQLFPGKIIGIYMQNWGQQQDSITETSNKCWEKDIKELESLQRHANLRIDELIVKSFEKEYWMNVFEPFLETYSKGETPNPDIYCNSLIKFKALMEYIDLELEKNNDRDYQLVMGHYCQKLNEKGIHMAFDIKKDQSYYLSRVEPDNLQNCWFPLGHITKKECREYARQLNLPNFEKKDSVGICFVENEKRFNESSHSKGFSNFLSEYIDSKEGDFVSYLPKKLFLDDKNGKIKKHLRNSITKMDSIDNEIGKIVWNFKHNGIHSYTIGQRIQAIIPQIEGFKGKWYLSEKILEKNELVIVNGRDNPKLYRKEIHFKDVFKHYENNDKAEFVFKHRSLHLDEETGVIPLESLSNNSLISGNKCSGVSKGQFIVVYDATTKQVYMNAIIT